MNEIAWHFLIGMLISAWGSLPLGTVNLGVVQLSISRSVKAGIFFAFGATLVELVYSTIAVKYFSVYLTSNPGASVVIEIIAIPLFVLLGIYSLRTKDAPQGPKKEDLEGTSFVKGIIIGIVNPLQIPFWVGYTTYCMTKSWIKDDPMLLNVYIAGICTGTMGILTVIAILSRKFLVFLDKGTGIVNKVIAYILFALAGFQLVKLIVKIVA